MADVKKIIEEGRLHIALTADDKTFVKKEEMIALLAVGPSIRHLNERQIGGNYVTEIEYVGVPFVTVTPDPLDFTLHHS